MLRGRFHQSATLLRIGAQAVRTDDAQVERAGPENAKYEIPAKLQSDNATSLTVGMLLGALCGLRERLIWGCLCPPPLYMQEDDDVQVRSLGTRTLSLRASSLRDRERYVPSRCHSGPP
jgi:hypothetical protein